LLLGAHQAQRTPDDPGRHEPQRHQAERRGGSSAASAFTSGVIPNFTCV